MITDDAISAQERKVRERIEEDVVNMAMDQSRIVEQLPTNAPFDRIVLNGERVIEEIDEMQLPTNAPFDRIVLNGQHEEEQMQLPNHSPFDRVV
jgi:hypothetical protein